MQTEETRLKNSILIDCGLRGWICYHTNVGKVRQADGSYFSTGLPKGWPDLIVLTNSGITFYAETKSIGKEPNDEQIKIINLLRSMNHKVAVVHSIEEWNNFLFLNNF